MNFRKTISHILLSAMASLLMISSIHAEAATVNEPFYANGGIGIKEANEMRDKADEFNLRLYMSEGEEGNFITGAKIIIMDNNNNVVLNVSRGGPMLFAKVEDGTYKISATYKRTEITKDVMVNNTLGENVYLIWKSTKPNEN